MVGESSVISRGEAPIAVECDGELVMLDTEAGRYMGLSPVGTRIWELIEQPRTVAEIADLLQSEYDVSAEVCRRETLAFVAQLAENGLVRVDGRCG